MTEQQRYEVERRAAGYELRRYPSYAVAEVTVQTSFESAGNAAFSALFGYIGGRNRSRGKVAMTAPVVQGAAPSEKVSMTAPVVQRPAESGAYCVAFVLPASLTAQTAPVPTDPRVTIRDAPGGLAAAVRYSGRWTESAYQRHLDELLAAVRADGLRPVGTPRYARFDPPVTPWFLRRNEVVIDVEPELEPPPQPDAQP